MEFRILGPLEVVDGERALALGTPLAQSVLGILLANVGEIVSTDQLAEELWPDKTSVDARSELHVYVSRLRKVLGSAGRTWLVTRSPGYVLNLEPGELDLHRFDDLVAEARAARAVGDHQRSVALFRQAHAGWRGAPLEGLPSTPSIEFEAARLTEYRLTTLEELAEAELATGADEELTAGLGALADQHPFRERLRALQMLALYRAGRRTEALEVFRTTCETLATELGIDPSPQLARLHRRILREDPELTAGPRPQVRRNDLPGDIADFTGRDTELRRLLELQTSSTVIIEAIDGMAGVGKTVLAVHAAHRLVDRYPDAQLFIDLNAHSAGQPPTDPADALDTLLRAVGVPGGRIPDDLAERSALWRAELAGRKALVVLDNAVDAAQVSPLLPGTAGCLALITSRRRLGDLEGARTLSLDVLPREDAHALFAGIVGDARADADPESTAEVLELCGYLALAIRIAASRLRARPAWTTAHLVQRLRDEQRRLTELSVGDRSVASAFALSYKNLTEYQQRLFRLLGLVPGPDFDSFVAAALTSTSLDQAEEGLEDLVDVHLLQQTSPGRYHFHDLMRQHARDTAHDTDTAVRRMLDYYLHAATTAANFIDPGRKPITGAAMHSPVIKGYDEALAWQEAEFPNLIAAIGLAAANGWFSHACRLFSSLYLFCVIRNRAHDLIAAGKLVRPAAARLAERRVLADVLSYLGVAHQRLARYDDAIDHSRQALALYRKLDCRDGEGVALNTLGFVHVSMSQFDQALDHLRAAVEIHRDLGDHRRESSGLNSLGIVCQQLGRYGEADESLRRALTLYRELGSRDGEAVVLSTLGYLCAAVGRGDEAVAHIQHAIEIHCDIGDRRGEGYDLCYLGFVRQQSGRCAEAAEYQRRALMLLRGVGDRYGEGWALTELGSTLNRSGRHREAVERLTEALALQRECGHRYDEARTLTGLGTAYLHLGRRADGLECLERAVAIHREINTAHGETEALNELGDAYRLVGDMAKAKASHQRALDLARANNNPRCEARAVEGLRLS